MRSLTAAVIMTVSLAVWFAGCAPVTINSYTEPGANFGSYATFGWAPGEERPTGDPRLDNNPFFAERLKTEVEQQLGRRGYVSGTDEEPDLLVRTLISLRDEVNTNRYERELQPTSPPGERPQPFVFEASTLWITVVDRRTNTVIWRGWAEGTFDGVIDDQTVMERKIGELVARILATLPAR